MKRELYILERKSLTEGALICMLLSAILLLIPQPSLGLSDLAQKEKLLRAAFLYNFAKFTTWPEPPSDEVRICIYGNNILGSAFKSVDGKKISSAVVVTRQIRRVHEVPQCHVLYVPGDYNSSLSNVLKMAMEKSVLTVGDTEEFLKKGGVVAFQDIDNRVKFVVNNRQAERNSLTLSARMLRVAHRVENSNEVSTLLFRQIGYFL